MVREFLLSDPAKFAYELYGLEYEKEYTTFRMAEEGFMVIYTRFSNPSISLYARTEKGFLNLFSMIGYQKFILFTDIIWEELVRQKLPRANVYKINVMYCTEPKLFPNERVRKLSIEDVQAHKKELRSFYREETIREIINGLKEGKLKIYGLLVDDELVSSAFITAESEKVGVIRGVYTDPKYRNKGLATSLVSYITKDLTDRGKIASLRVRSDNFVAIKVYKKVGYIDDGIILWVDNGTGIKPL